MNDRSIEINQNINNISIENQRYSATDPDKVSIISLYERFKTDPDCKRINFSTKNNPTELFEQFKSIFKSVEAAGGIVRNDKNEILFINRWGIWDLPKGKKKKNEALRNTAIREVMEETGLLNLQITQVLQTTYHIYTDKNNKEILKSTSWFEMNCKGNCKTIPQAEEGIAEAKWVAEIELDDILKNTYASLTQLLHDYLSNYHQGDNPLI